MSDDLDAAKARAAAHPDDVEAQIACAYAHDRVGLESEAVRYYDRAWALGIPEPGRRGFIVGYGSTLRNVGRADEAVAILAEAVQTYPDYPALHAFLALALFSAGHPRAALAAMLGTALDVSRPGVFDGYERALTEYHQELLAASVEPMH
jgi:tetratricopeptide (TPR) repeat protein